MANKSRQASNSKDDEDSNLWESESSFEHENLLDSQALVNSSVNEEFCKNS